MSAASQLAALQATLEGFQKSVEAGNKAASAQRQATLEALTEIEKEQVSIRADVRQLQKEVSTIKPVIAGFQSGKNMVLGGAIVLGFIGSAIVLFWQTLSDRLWDFFFGG
ncbi:hypothetical protein DVVG_00013 [Dunaliella viridis virus SI2]|uniref:hypothetical protein n=1 Tax=Dunaliella viridis virus SI2 TaxID=754069 RepID=UPI0002C116F0|nr:hypothetical protein DVVG_00013 [Dunaliella viridis virus SI2]AGH15999.1 hypothetical protein DVVG_00013 [Dunaliella viridis virus SI2]